MTDLEEFAYSEARHAANVAWTAIHPGQLSFRQLVTQSVFACFFIYDNDIQPAVSVKITIGEKLVFRFVNKRLGGGGWLKSRRRKRRY
jgi:hypothetical protein